MKKIYSILFSLVFSLSAFAQLPSNLEAKLQDTLLDLHTQYNFKGLSVAVSYEGIGTWESATGISSTNLPLNSSMGICIGSNTKTFVSVLMLKLYESGQISLNDTIGKWIQGVPNIKGNITITQLLKHTSGLFNYTEHDDFADSIFHNLSRVWTKEELINKFVDVPYFQPGQSWQYSNTNYLVAGIIEEAVTGIPLNTLIRDSILTPLNLDHTYFPPYEQPAYPDAGIWSVNWYNSGSGYLEEWVSLSPELYTWADAAGGIISTPKNVNQFFQGLFRGDLVSKQTLNNKMLFQMFNLGSGTYYGLGIFKEFVLGQKVFSHGGTIWSMNSNLIDTTRKVAICVLTNQDSLDNEYTDKVLKALYRVVLNNPLSTEINMDTKIQLSLYPNPVSNILTLESEETFNGQISLYAVNGELIYSSELTTNKWEYNTNHIPSGIYILEFQSEGKHYAPQKIVIQH